MINVLTALIPQVLTASLTSSVLLISAGSAITFNLSLNFTETIDQVIIYGVSYTEQSLIPSLATLRNGQVMTRASTEMPPITGRGAALNNLQCEPKRNA